MPRIKGRKPEETRGAILAAAVEVFAERGYSNATLASIAAVAGVTAATLPYHFTDKRGVWDATLAVFYGDLLAFAADMKLNRPLDELLAELYGWCESRRASIRVILRHILEAGGLDADLEARMGPALEFVSLLGARRFGVEPNRVRDCAIAISHLVVRFVTNSPEDNRLAFGEKTHEAARARILAVLGHATRGILGLERGP